MKLNIKVNEAIQTLQNEFKKEKEKFDYQRAELDLEFEYNETRRSKKQRRVAKPQYVLGGPRVEASPREAIAVKSLFDMNGERKAFFGDETSESNQISQIKEDKEDEIVEAKQWTKGRKASALTDEAKIGYRKGSASSRVHGDAGQYYKVYKR